MPSSAILLPLMAFDDACKQVVDHLKQSVPLAFWSVSRYENDRQVYVCVEDDAYGKTAGGSHAWSDSFCQYMVVGRTPEIAPDAMSVPEYASAGVAKDLTIGAYAGVPIRGADGSLYGTICGMDPKVAPPNLTEQAPLLHLFASLLGRILQAENLRAEAVDREERVAWTALHDDLTGLPNRSMFFDRVEHALELGARDGRAAAVLLLDLDEFKAVNDTLGHAAGDEVLAMTAHRLQRAVRPGDTLARLSGDEFAVLLEGPGDPSVVAGRLVEALTEPFVIGQRQVAISASVGVAELAEDEETTVEGILARADIAMYTAKRAGKGRYAVYDPLMSLPGSRTLQLREPLRQALEKGVVEAHYQPIVDLHSGATVSFEALARWQHDGDSVGPDVFVPIASRSGLMPALTEHMLDQACAELAKWSAQIGHRRLRVSVNVSPHSMSDPTLPDRVALCMDRHDLGQGQLVMEITEDALLHNLPTALTVARRLRDLGVVLSLDDFGAGYSSLLHLRQIPLDSIKIDRGFAEDIDTNPETERFLHALIALGRDLKLRVIVEGVERHSQVEVLRRIGATFAQGHYFGRPVPARLVRVRPTDGA